MTSRILTTLALFALLTLPRIGYAEDVTIGSSYEDVIESLGEPDGELSAGSKQILTYGKAKITLRNRKVTALSDNIEHLLIERAATKESVNEKREAGLVNFRGQWVTPDKRDQLQQVEAQKRLKHQSHRASSGVWLTDFDQAFEIAKQENKKLLLNFTGSDWCGWCIRLDKEVFSKREFNDYARTNYVLVKLDFPRSNSQPKAEAQQNKALAQKFGIRGFPTIVVLNPSGKVYKKGGYVRGGPQAFLQAIR